MLMNDLLIFDLKPVVCKLKKFKICCVFGVRTWRQHPVDLADFVENFSGVILHRGAFVEMYSDWKLASVHLDDGRGNPKQLCIVCEVLHSQGSRHDQQLHGHTFLQRDEDKCIYNDIMIKY